jgi:rhodanese-related sulfurtransferase
MKQHTPRFLALVHEAKKQIKEITPQALKALMDSKKSFCLIDIRDENELSSGRIPTAIHLSKGIIERDIEKQLSDSEEHIVVYCSGGFRGALTALNLQKMGYSNVYSLDTGLQGWINAGYPLNS